MINEILGVIPQSDSDDVTILHKYGITVCPCGKMNPIENHQCVRCGKCIRLITIINVESKLNIESK